MDRLTENAIRCSKKIENRIQSDYKTIRDKYFTQEWFNRISEEYSDLVNNSIQKKRREIGDRILEMIGKPAWYEMDMEVRQQVLGPLRASMKVQVEEQGEIVQNMLINAELQNIEPDTETYMAAMKLYAEYSLRGWALFNALR